MKKYLDKLKINKNLFISLLVIVIVALITGAFFSSILNTSDKNLITEYLNKFLTSTFTNKLSYISTLKTTIFFNLLFILFMWILGISVIGFIIIIFMLFIKAFVIGFSVGSFISIYKWKGIFISFIYIFPHHVINILIYIILSAFALTMSFQILLCFTKQKINLRIYMKKYSLVLMICIIILLLSSLYETLIMPRLLNIIEPLIK